MLLLTIIIVFNKVIGFIFTDFYKFITNTMINMKYDINTILNIVKSNSINIDTLMANTTTPLTKNIVHLENIIPIKSNDGLVSLENKIKTDESFRNTLVNRVNVANYIMFWLIQ